MLTTKRSKHTRSKKQPYRVYVRNSGGVDYYYGDFRKLGGGREALKVPGDQRATVDREVAQKLAAERAAELITAKKTSQRTKAGLEKRCGVGLKAFAAKHLIQKAKAGKVTDKWLDRTEVKLSLAVKYFGANRELDTVTVEDVQAFLLWLQERPGRRGNAQLSAGAQRHYINALSNLYRRAQAEGVVTPGYNPVAFMLEKPTAKREEARWLEVHEAALLLESARTYKPQNEARALLFMYPLLATFLLTGGRKSEVLGLQVDDISFDRETVTFRPHGHRRLKTETSYRTVPLWPQLCDILRAYLRDTRRVGGLLFPSPSGGDMVSDFRKQLDIIGGRGGWNPGEVRSKAFRHTYCAARLQTLDRGAPVSPFTVARELGHGGMSLVNRVYGHLGTVRHRSEAVEYRVGQHKKILAPRLKLLRSA